MNFDIYPLGVTGDVSQSSTSGKHRPSASTVFEHQASMMETQRPVKPAPACDDLHFYIEPVMLFFMEVHKETSTFGHTQDSNSPAGNSCV